VTGRKGVRAAGSGADRSGRAGSGRPGHRPGALTVALASLALLLLGLPVLALVIRAATGGALVSQLGQRAILDALALSLATTSVSLVAVVILGTPLGLVLARRRFRGRSLAEAIVDLPIVLPPSVAGLALLLAFGRNGLLGPGLEVLGLVVPFTTVAVVVAQVFVAMPFFVRAVRAGFRSIEPELEDAARVDGGSEGEVLRRVTLPLAAPALGAGLVLAWARAMGEFGATIMFAGNLPGRTQTLPLLVYSEFQASLDAAVAAATILVLAALGVLVAVRWRSWTASAAWPA
jgi:molybdate transport system permease protein